MGEHGCGGLPGSGHYSREYSSALWSLSFGVPCLHSCFRSIAGIFLGSLCKGSRLGSRGNCIPHNLSVDGAGHAVLELQVHLGDSVLGEDRGIGDVTYIPTKQLAFPKFFFSNSSPAECGDISKGEIRHTDGGGLNHVADGESLDRLVLRSASRAVGATDGLDVATTALVASATRRKHNVSLVSGVSRYRYSFGGAPTWTRAS